VRVDTFEASADNALQSADRGRGRPGNEARMSVTAIEELQAVRDRVLPMLEQVVADYEGRVPGGYPAITDSVRQGVIGIELDPSFSLFFTTDGEQVFADFYYRSHRIDARSSASREKFAGRPVDDHRPLPASVSDLELRNLIAELLARWNMQPTLIHITDS
jgi:hypothetical protein